MIVMAGVCVTAEPGLTAIYQQPSKMAGVFPIMASIYVLLVKKQTLADYVVKIFQQYRKI